MPAELVWTDEAKKDVVERICASVAAGTSVTRSMQMLDGMPHPNTFWRWMMVDDWIGEKVARAREAGVEALLEMAMDIANTPKEGVETEEIAANDAEIEEGGTIIKVKRSDMIAHRRLQIDTIHKRAQMIAPRKYGAKLDLTSDGEKIGALAAAISAGNRRVEQADE